MTSLDAKKLTIGYGEHAVFLGQTGTGKTTLAKAIAWKSRGLVVADPKRTFTLPHVESWPVTYTENISDVEKWDSPYPIVYRPTFEYQRDDRFFERFFGYCFERGNVIVYVDEVTRVTTRYKIGEEYERCLKLGRERKVGCWSASQRPVHVPLEVLTEATKWFVFSLLNPDDRDRVAGFIGRETLEKKPTGHGFWYFDDKQRPTKKLRYYDSARVGGIVK